MTLAAGLGGLVIMMSLLAVGTVQRLSHAAGRYELAARNALDELLLAERLRGAMDEAVATGRGYLLTRSPSLLARLRHSETVVDDLLTKLATRATEPDDGPAAARVLRTHREYRASLDEAVVRRRNGAEHEVMIGVFESELLPRRRQLDQAIDDFVAGRDQQLSRLREEVARRRAGALSGAGVTLGLGILGSLLGAALFGRYLARLYHRESLALDRAERATAAREELLAVVAHDLRSPLSAIALRATQLRSRRGPEKAAQLGEAIARVVASAERLLRTLLDLASIDAGRFSVDRGQCEATVVLGQVVDVFGDLASSQGVVLDCDPEGLAVTLLGDGERLFQVFSNLVGNALKFAPARSVITVGATRTSDGVHFTVTDEGPGIAAADLPFIFDRFWTNRAGGNKGTGLGLHITRQIVDAYGGRIWAESELGRGTTIHFTVPASPSVAVAVADQRA
jgi:signal transduction histidine kinase